MSDTADQNDEKPAFAIAVQYLKGMSFDNVGAPESYRMETDKGEASNEIKIDVQIAPMGDDDHHEVQLLIELVNSVAEAQRFVLRASYAAIVLVRDISDEDREMLLNVETPRFLFPFLRAIISQTTHDAGYPALNLSPIDFRIVYAQRKKQESEASDS